MAIGFSVISKGAEEEEEVVEDEEEDEEEETTVAAGKVPPAWRIVFPCFSKKFSTTVLNINLSWS